MAKKSFSFVNIIFFVVFGVLTGVLWAYLCPIPLIPGAVHFRTFAFIIPVIGYLFGPVTGFFAGYIGTLVWSLLSGMFIPLHSPIADGITVGLSAALPAFFHLKNGKLDLVELIEENKGKFIRKCLFLSVFFGILMILSTSASLAYFLMGEKSYMENYIFCIVWIGIADVVPIALTPFVVVLLAKRMKNIRNIIPYV
jgi:energy-coupling factor transport system substrate-specific component